MQHQHFEIAMFKKAGESAAAGSTVKRPVAVMMRGTLRPPGKAPPVMRTMRVVV
jgi:hypothetical protein